MNVAQEDLDAKVLGIEEMADHRKCFTIERPAGFDFEAGQHMYVETRPDWGAPFTIVSAPGDEHLAFTTVMRDASPLKKELGALNPGDTVIVSGPYGDFTCNESIQKIGMIAGGIGITPFISILHDMGSRGLTTDVVLLYSSRRRSDTPYLQALERLAADNHNIEVVFTMTDDPGYDGHKGRIDQAFVEAHGRGVADRTWYIAGPPGLVEAFDGLLRQMGVVETKLDEFEGY
jgi:ferredoxin-NADP reductase